MREAIWKLSAELGMSLFVFSSFDSDMKGCLLPYDGQENALTMEGDNFVLAKTPGRFTRMPSLSWKRRNGRSFIEYGVTAPPGVMLVMC